jgi:hypothetical protein
MTSPARGHEKQPKDAQSGNTCRPPDYVIVVSQLRGQPWSDGMSLEEILETGRTPSREAEADWEAEP